MTTSTLKVIVYAIAIIGAIRLGYGQEANSNNFESYKIEISQALQANDYRTARLLLEESLPLLKMELKSMKNTKKDLHKKGANEVVLQAFDRIVSRENQIFHRLKHIVHISPAAMRVKAGSVRQMLTELTDLSQEKNLLGSDRPVARKD